LFVLPPEVIIKIGNINALVISEAINELFDYDRYKDCLSGSRNIWAE
jgi:hypothetical protein